MFLFRLFLSYFLTCCHFSLLIVIFLDILSFFLTCLCCPNFIRYFYIEPPLPLLKILTYIQDRHLRIRSYVRSQDKELFHDIYVSVFSPSLTDFLRVLAFVRSTVKVNASPFCQVLGIWKSELLTFESLLLFGEPPVQILPSSSSHFFFPP